MRADYQVDYRGSLLYGAYEQKRLYQRHLSAALAVVTLAVISLVAISFVACDSEPPLAVTTVPPPVGAVIDLGGSFTTIPGNPNIRVEGRSVSGREGYHPVETTGDDVKPDTVFDGGLDDGVFSGIRSDESTGGEGNNGSTLALFPGPNDFIVAEILPAFVHQEFPQYPRLARDARVEGTVWVKVLVDKSGLVRDALIAKDSHTNAGFEQAALAAARKCKFSPAIQNGTPIAIWVTFPFEFRLSR